MRNATIWCGGKQDIPSWKFCPPSWPLLCQLLQSASCIPWYLGQYWMCLPPKLNDEPRLSNNLQCSSVYADQVHEFGLTAIFISPLTNAILSAWLKTPFTSSSAAGLRELRLLISCQTSNIPKWDFDTNERECRAFRTAWVMVCASKMWSAIQLDWSQPILLNTHQRSYLAVALVFENASSPTDPLQTCRGDSYKRLSDTWSCSQPSSAPMSVGQN